MPCLVRMPQATFDDLIVLQTIAWTRSVRNPIPGEFQVLTRISCRVSVYWHISGDSGFGRVPCHCRLRPISAFPNFRISQFSSLKFAIVLSWPWKLCNLSVPLPCGCLQHQIWNDKVWQFALHVRAFEQFMPPGQTCCLPALFCQNGYTLWKT